MKNIKEEAEKYANYLKWLKEDGLLPIGKDDIKYAFIAGANFKYKKSHPHPTLSDKALALLKAFHDIAHNSEKNEGLTITKDWDINTLTIETKDGHNHFGQMNSEDDEGFSILLNQMYKHFVIK